MKDNQKKISVLGGYSDRPIPLYLNEPADQQRDRVVDARSRKLLKLIDIYGIHDTNPEQELLNLALRLAIEHVKGFETCRVEEMPNAQRRPISNSPIKSLSMLREVCLRIERGHSMKAACTALAKQPEWKKHGVDGLYKWIGRLKKLPAKNYLAALSLGWSSKELDQLHNLLARLPTRTKA